MEDILGTDEDIVSKEFQNNEDEILLKMEIDKLTGRDKEIMVMRYGLDNGREYTQKEVADKLNISQSYISRIEKKVVKRLQTLLRV